MALTEFPEPASTLADPADLFGRYLDFYRETIARKLGELSDDQARTSRLPSGWTPIELLSHVAYVERRWFVWGFLGEDVPDPWGDRGPGLGPEPPTGPWHVPPSVTVAELVELLRSIGLRTTEILGSTPLDRQAEPGGRFDDETPTLSWICFHVLQEYARHAGHLDIAVELAAGATGE